MEQRFLHELLLRDVKELRGKCLTIAGCGALGSWAALLLAKAGADTFRLIDRDRVEEHNLSTQFFPPWSLGSTKVQALSEILYQFYKCRVERHPIELTRSNALQLLRGSDLVICSFDNKEGRETVKDICLRHGIPCVFGAMHGEHFYAHIEWAEDFDVPEDPAHYEIDPCDYPLAVSLSVFTSSLLAEAAIRFLLDGDRRKARTGMLEVLGR